MAHYRTKTYVAGAWTEDQDAIEELYKWNESAKYELSFVNVHDFKSARDGSLNCSIRKSLSERMDMCKHFVLIVGNKTKVSMRVHVFTAINSIRITIDVAPVNISQLIVLSVLNAKKQRGSTITII